MPNKVLLIGLGEIGTTIGLALAGVEGEILRIGFDPDKKTGRQAKTIGAIDRLISHPLQAVESADLIILDLPFHESEAYLQGSGGKTKAGVVIIHTAPLKTAFFDWAAGQLPADRHALSATPIAGTFEDSSAAKPETADRFRGGQLAITVTPKTPESALAVVIKLAKLLKADPFFIDAHEFDAATAALDDLPTLMSFMIFHLAAASPSWRDFQRVAGSIFKDSTDLVETDPDHMMHRVRANQENILAQLDALVGELTRLRSLLSQESPADLKEYFEHASRTRSSWLALRAIGDWAGEDLPGLPKVDRGGVMRQLFGLGRRNSKE